MTNKSPLSQSNSEWDATQLTRRTLLHLTIVLVLMLLQPSGGFTADLPSKWDISLPALPLQNIKIEANSLPEAWQEAATSILLRSVLLISEDTPTQAPFAFEKAICTGKDVLDALVAAYPGYTWTSDPTTGIIWVHSAKSAYDGILSAKITVPNSQLGLPMLGGVLGTLTGIPSLGLVGGGRSRSSTYDYPVDLPAGTYSVRDILNRCCLANPTKTFYIRPDASNRLIIQAGNLNSDEIPAPRPGALSFWTIEIGPAANGVPSSDEIATALASANARIRWAARAYLEATIWTTPFDKIVADSIPPEKGVWMALGILNVLVRSTNHITHYPSVERLQKECSEDFYLKGDPKCAILVACELARVAQDTKGLELVAKRKLTQNDLSGVMSDLCWSARGSRLLCDKIVQLNPDWAGFSKDTMMSLDKGVQLNLLEKP
jgi:hypothetical protein